MISGDKGDKGDTGVGISKLEVIDGALYVTLTNNVKENAGVILTDEVKAWLVSQITDNAESDFNTYYNSKVTEFNTNADEKLEEYNTNADEKLEEYNTNATNKINEYNTNAEAILKILPKTETEIQENIDIDDAGESSFNKLSVFGNSKQESTEGRNLLYEIRSGYLTTVENQEATTTEGSEFGNWQINFKNKDGSTSISLEAGEYYVSLDLKINSGSVSNPLNLIAVSEKDGQETINNPVPTTEYQRYCFKSIFNSAKNVNNIIIQKHYDEEVCSFKIKNVMISKMSDYNYEPYTGGNPSPNPDYPQEIKYIKANKNILDETAEKVNAFPTGNVGEEIGYTNSMYTVTYKNCMKVKKDQKYKLTFNRNEPSAESVPVQYITDENDIILETFNLNIEDATNEKLEFTSNYDGYLNLVLDKNATNIRIEEADAGIRFKRINNLSNFPTEGTGKTSGTNYAGITYEIKNKYTSIISGKPTAPEFRVGGSYDSTQIVVPFDKSKQYKLKNSLNLGMVITLVNSSNNTFIEKNIESGETIQLDNIYDGLSSLRFNVNIETTYNNDVLQYYIYDVEEEYNLPVQQEMLEEDTFEKVDGNWYEVHNRTFYECTGTENWLMEEINNSGKYRYGFYNYPFGADINKISESICTHFKAFNQYGVQDSTFGIEPASIRLNFNPQKTFETVEEFKDWLVEQKNAGTPVRIYYYLETPTKLPCTPEQVEVLNQLEQFSLSKGINHIYSDDELSPKFKLKYYQDMNILLDKINKNIADVSAQLIEGGSNV